MDTLKILLAATVALLVGALAVALNKGGSGKDEDKTEYAEIKLEIEKLRLERENLEQQRRLQMLQDATLRTREAAPSPPPIPTMTAANDEAAMAKIQELEAQNAALEAGKAKAEHKADVADKEAAFVGGAMLERHDKTERRRRQIANAMLMATVKEWAEDPNSGAFAIIDVVERDKVQQGTQLSVRRKDGILGKLRVDSVTVEGVIANAVTAFPGPKPEPGDDLILDPEE